MPLTGWWQWPVRSNCRRSAATFCAHLEKLTHQGLSSCFYHSISGISINHRIFNNLNYDRLQSLGTAYCRFRHHFRPIGWDPPFYFLLHYRHNLILWSCIILLNSIMIFKNGRHLRSINLITFTIVIFITPRCLAIPNYFLISIWITMVLEIILLLLS